MANPAGDEQFRARSDLRWQSGAAGAALDEPIFPRHEMPEWWVRTLGELRPGKSHLQWSARI